MRRFSTCQLFCGERQTDMRWSDLLWDACLSFFAIGTLLSNWLKPFLIFSRVPFHNFANKLWFSGRIHTWKNHRQIRNFLSYSTGGGTLEFLGVSICLPTSTQDSTYPSLSAYGYSTIGGDGESANVQLRILLQTLNRIRTAKM